MAKEKYIHPIYGPCEREIEEKIQVSPNVWIPKPLYRRELDPYTGQEWGEHKHRYFKTKGSKGNMRGKGTLIKVNRPREDGLPDD